MIRVRLLLFSLLCFILLAPRPVWAQEKKGRNDSLLEAFEKVALKSRSSTVLLKEGLVPLGYAVCIDEENHFVTARACVRGRDDLVAVSVDGARTPVEVVAESDVHHVALLKIQTNARPIPRRKEKEPPKIGSFVIAIGTDSLPLAAGVVSATKREVPKVDRPVRIDPLGIMNENKGPQKDHPRILQHDAPVRAEDYGSPLVDRRGRLLGVNVETGYRGSSYAVPTPVLMKLVESWLGGARPWIGLFAKKAGPMEKAKAQGEDQIVALGDCLVVTRVEEEGPAAKAGLEPGDLIIKAGEQRLRSLDDLGRIVKRHRAGSRLPVVIVRKGEKIPLMIQVESK